MPKTLVTIILQTTSHCNLHCSYCYCQTNLTTASKLSFSTFKDCILKVDSFFDNDSELCFLFHGGEPLLLGKNFFDEAFRFLKQHMKHKYYTGIQTNLILLDGEFIELFRQNDCSISTSLDGYPDLNDLHRKYYNGRGTYDDVMRSLMLLREKKVRYGIVSVITRNSVKNPTHFYHFMKEHPKVLFGLSPMFLKQDESIVAPNPEDLGDFLVTLFDLWVADQAPPRISFFEEIVGNFLENNRGTVCTFHHDCTETFIAIDSEGNVYPCCHFVGTKPLCYGNLLRSSFHDVYNSDSRLHLSKRAIRSNNSCQTCEFFKMCFSGCMATSENSILSKDYFCNAYKMIFLHVKNHLLDELL